MISQTVNGLERRITFRPGFHKVNADPKKDYGVHSMEIWFYVIGPKGAVHFGLYSGMHLQKTWDWWKATGRMQHAYKLDMGVDVGYHSPVPRYEGQNPVQPSRMKIKEGFDITNPKNVQDILDNVSFEKVGDRPPVCELLGVPCYSDGSAMRAEPWHETLIEKGDDAIWEMLEGEYKATFGE